MRTLKDLTIESIWESLSKSAWMVRDNAHIFGNTKVGAALITEKQNIYSGCNIEHIFRSHDVHAEVNAISNMVSNGDKKFTSILIVAERIKFTPCGSCMDWIFQHGGSDCEVGFQSKQGGEIIIYTASELMPHYPK